MSHFQLSAESSDKPQVPLYFTGTSKNILRMFHFPNELKLQMEKNKATKFLLEQSSSYRIWRRPLTLITPMYVHAC